MTGTVNPLPYPESWHVRAFWGSRKESAEECARRAMDFLNGLASCDPLLAAWNKIPKPRGKGRKTPLMPPDLAGLTAAFKRGFNREPGGPPIEELGLTVAAYNDGTRQDFASLSMRCGSYARGDNSNACLLDLPSRGPSAERLLTLPLLANVLQAMVSCWDPDRVMAGSMAYLPDREPNAPPFSLHWLAYFSRRLGRVPPLLAPVRIEPLSDQGTLIILAPERVTAANPEHVALARRAYELLSRAGLPHR